MTTVSAEARHNIEHLPAIAPGVIDGMAAHVLDEPAVAVGIAGERRGRARRPGFLDPALGHDALAVDGSAQAVHLAEAQQGAGRQGHLVAAEVDALRVAGPGRKRDVEGLAEPVAGQRRACCASRPGSGSRTTDGCCRSSRASARRARRRTGRDSASRTQLRLLIQAP